MQQVKCVLVGGTGKSTPTVVVAALLKAPVHVRPMAS